MKRRGVDSCHSWILAFSGTLVMLTTSGSFFGSSGVLYKAYLDVYQLTEEEASWPSSIHAGMAILSGPVTAFLNTRMSIRTASTLAVLLYTIGCCVCFFSTSFVFLCIFYGAVSGLGDYMSNTLVPALMARVFERYRVMAMGIVLMSIPLGSLIFPLITKALLECYGLNGTFLMLGAISMHGIVGSIALAEHDNKGVEKVGGARKSKSASADSRADDFHGKSLDEPSRWSNPSVESIRKNISGDVGGVFHISDTASKPKQTDILVKPNSLISRLSKVIRIRGFHVSNLAQCMSFLLSFLFILVIIDYATKKNISSTKAFYLLLIYSVGLIGGRFILGFISDKNMIPKTVYMFIAYGLVSALNFIVPFVFQYEWLVVITVFFSILFGNLVPISNVMFVDYVPKEDIVLAMSVGRSTTGLVSLSRSVIIGLFSGGISSYDYMFIFMGALSLLTSITMIAEFLWERRLRSKAYNL